MKRLQTFGVITILLVVLVYSSSASDYIAKYYLHDINSDGYPDTLQLDQNKILRHIVWGSNPPCDSCRTYIVYNDTTLISSKFSLIKFDTDTTKDIYIVNRYRIDDIDSVFQFVLIGNEKLRYADTITYFMDRIEPAYLDVYSGVENIFESVSYVTPGSMIAAKFRRVELDTIAPVPQMKEISSIDNSMNSDLQIKIYPNPTDKVLYYLLIGFESGMYNLEIQDFLLKSVYREMLAVNSSYFKKFVNLSGLPNGLYLIRFYNENFVKSQLFILSK